MRVPNFQVNYNFFGQISVNCRSDGLLLTAIFLANSQLTANFGLLLTFTVPRANIIPSSPEFFFLQQVNHFWG